MEKFYPIVVIVVPEADAGGYLGFAPDLPGCMSPGDTPEEALGGAQAAVLEWIDEARAQSREVPEPHSAAAAMLADRKRLIEQLQEQKRAFEAVDAEVKMLRKNMEDALAIALEKAGEGQPALWGFASVTDKLVRTGDGYQKH